MVWHIKKTSMMGVGTVYYKGDNRWTDNYDERVTYSSQKMRKQRTIFGKKLTPLVGMYLL